MTKPPLAGLGFDLDGRLWIERTVPDGGPRRADVYGRDGRQVATAEWPAGVVFEQWVITDSVGLGVMTDSDGVRRVAKIVFRR